MIDVTPLLRIYARYRLNHLATLDPVESQREVLMRLIARAQATRFGRAHDFARIRDVADFQGRVPLRLYEDFWGDYWRAAFPVLDNVTWPGTVPYFAVTSGTTSGRSKYIPTTRAMLRSNAKAGADLFAYHLRARPQSRIMGGRSFMLGGSTNLVEEAPGIYSGDLSGITVSEMPWYARPRYYPPPALALLEDWEEKIGVLADRSPLVDIRMISGTPSWLLLFLDKAMSARGVSRIANLYPNLEMVVHGGVNFAPYRKQFTNLCAGSRAELREVYPASEGFVAMADAGEDQGLRLSLDHGLFFEFVPVEELGTASPTRHWLATVEPGVDYAVVMTTCAGLWAYVLGDTVRLRDQRRTHIEITGRTAQMLSAFGEHVIVAELDQAIAAAADACGVQVADYAVGAEFPGGPRGARGQHRVVVEFAPGVAVDKGRFAAVFDRHLQEDNDDYRAHRAEGVGLDAPHVLSAPHGTFAAWMKSRNRMGGQNKVPRVINDATVLADLCRFVDCYAQVSDSAHE
jgi:hypothetical protein